MNSIQIGKTIASNRKEKGLTQEDLAKHLGVSKPAVSKWESGQSYPDIILLPELASFFNITVDQLIGYEPQMSEEDIRKLYRRLSEAYAKEPFDKVYSECEEYIKKYFSCWKLLIQIGLLYINHASLAGSQEKSVQILERSLELFERVTKSTEDIALAKQALKLQAISHLTLQRPAEAIDILENINELQMPTEGILVKAYQMNGDKEKAIQYLQGYTYVNLIAILGTAPDFFKMYEDQPQRMEQYYNLFMDLSKLFEVDQLHPAILLQINLAAAMTYASRGNKAAAMDALEQYVNAIKKTGHEFSLHGNRIFDALESYLSTIKVGDALPRSSEVIWQDLKNALLNNPVFADLEEEERFLKLKKKMEEL